MILFSTWEVFKRCLAVELSDMDTLVLGQRLD